MALVVVARAGGGDLMWAIGLPDELFVDGKSLGVLAYHSACKVTVPPGHHTFTIKSKGFVDPVPNYSMNFEIDAKEGDEYFLRVKTTIGLIVGHPHLVPLEPEHKEHLLKHHPLDKMDERLFPE